MHELSDAELVAATRRGDQRAFAALVARYRDRHARFVARMLGDADEAEDVLQSVFVRAYRHIDRCEDPAKFGAWLHRIVVNESRTFASRRGQRELKLVRAPLVLDGLEAEIAEGDAALRRRIEAGRGRPAGGDEIDAGAEAMRQGVDGAAVSALAKTAPSGRSLAVPLFVVGSLVERGLPADQALARVQERLVARASDGDLERMAREQQRGRPEGVSPGMRPTDRPGATGRPENVPATGARPTPPVTPPTGPRRP